MPGSIGTHGSCLLTKLGQVAFRLQEAALAPLGLRVRHYSVLQALADLGPTVQIELGTYLRIDPATMAAALERLEKDGAVERERSVEDRRRFVVALTQDGEDLLGEIKSRLEEVDAILAGALEPQMEQGLWTALNTLARSPALASAYDAAR